MVVKMALFGSSKKTSTSIKKVRPTVVRTQNVAKEIFTLAKSYEIPPEKLDFNILDVQTYTRMNKDSKEAEWELMENEDLYAIDDENQLLNPDFQIKQIYEIEIFSKRDDESDIFLRFKSAVGANATKCKVYLSINSGAELEYQPRLEQDLRDMINKRKIRAGMLIYIFDDMLDDVISKLSARVRVAEKLLFEQNETYLIAEGYEPTATTDDALILHYEKNSEVDENTKIDYAARGFIQSVKEGELLLEYIKPKPGKPGRNCRGEFMQPAEPIVTNQPTFHVSENIKVQESDDSIKYIAMENGYIAFEKNTYLIKNEVDVGEISFKTTGSISSGIDSDVNISVREQDAIKDAVGTGMHVEVTEIEIDGNVGSNAKVIAKRASIGGQTHKTAYIKADDIDINVHKGKAEGINVKVSRLEHGLIEANHAMVAQALGGTIKAREIEIEICASHVKATASRRIEIKKLHGSENIFTIDPLLSKDLQNDVNEHSQRIKNLKSEMRDLKEKVTKYTAIVKEGTPAFLEIKKRLMHYKKNGVKMPESFVKKYKQFQKVQERLKEAKESFALAQDQLNLLTTRTASFQDNIFDARVINRDRWIGYNEIRFKLVDPPMELVYKPMEGSSEQVFGLVESSDGEFSIRPVSE